jgi:uncharacterized repeat protein (TIGR04138 family)
MNPVSDLIASDGLQKRQNPVFYVNESLDPAGTNSALYCAWVVTDRLGGEGLPHGSSTGNVERTGKTLTMHEATFEEGLELILAKDPRYQRDAYLFVREALDFTQKAIIKENKGQLRHVTGQELLGGIREFALAQFGPMSITVLEEWGIRSCADFGEIVFNMVEVGLLAKTENDTREDFKECYEFHDAFRKPYLPESRRDPPKELPEPSTRKED